MRSEENIAIIPNILHAIWLGGFPDVKTKKNIANWKITNPHYEVNLWVDSSTYPDDAKESLFDLINWAKKNDITICDINPKPRWIFSNETSYKNESDIYRGMKDKNINLQQYFDDELNGQHINYGAASDILRIEILYRIGGVYFDANDIFPNEKMESHIKTKEGFLFNNETVCNDVLASTPYGKIITDYRSLINENYKKLYMNEANLNAHRSDAWRNAETATGNIDSGRAESTVNLTGPGALLDCIKDYNQENLAFPSGYFAEDQHAGSWFKKGIESNPEMVAAIFRNFIRGYFNKKINEEIANLSNDNIKNSIQFMKSLPNAKEQESPLINLLKFKKALNAFGTDVLDMNQIYEACSKIDVKPELQTKLKNLCASTEILAACIGAGYELNQACLVKIPCTRLFTELQEFHYDSNRFNRFISEVMTEGSNPKPDFDKLNNFGIRARVLGDISQTNEPWIQKMQRIESYAENIGFSTLQDNSKKLFIEDLLSSMNSLGDVIVTQHNLDKDNLNQISDFLTNFDDKNIPQFEQKKQEMLNEINGLIELLDESKKMGY